MNVSVWTKGAEEKEEAEKEVYPQDMRWCRQTKRASERKNE